MADFELCIMCSQRPEAAIKQDIQNAATERNPELLRKTAKGCAQAALSIKLADEAYEKATGDARIKTAMPPFRCVSRCGRLQ